MRGDIYVVEEWKKALICNFLLDALTKKFKNTPHLSERPLDQHGDISIGVFSLYRDQARFH
jgi:hypothetical protein